MQLKVIAIRLVQEGARKAAGEGERGKKASRTKSNNNKIKRSKNQNNQKGVQ